MKFLFVTSLALVLHASFCVQVAFSAVPSPAVAQDSAAAPASVQTPLPTWSSSQAQHVYGFPDLKPHKKGSLTLSADELVFSGKSGTSAIRRSAIRSVSAGNQRVELWGIGGRVLRSAIPDGGGIAAAAVMHHRVDMLTIEFVDGRGGNHGAVFLLPAHEADRALDSFALAPVPAQRPSNAVCANAAVEPNSVLVTIPAWDQAEVPAAYRTLVYEHVIARLRAAKGVGHVYSDGEVNSESACPQYIIHLAVKAFQEGSSVKRAAFGPVGFFVGTTHIAFDVTYTDASGKLHLSEEIKATIRGESESTNIADHVAKTLAKRYRSLLKNNPETHPTHAANSVS